TCVTYSFQRSAGRAITVSTPDGATIRKYESGEVLTFVKTKPREYQITATESKKNLAGRTDEILGDLEHYKYVAKISDFRKDQEQELRRDEAKNKLDDLNNEFNQAQAAGNIVECD